MNKILNKRRGRKMEEKIMEYTHSQGQLYTRFIKYLYTLVEVYGITDGLVYCGGNCVIASLMNQIPKPFTVMTHISRGGLSVEESCNLIREGRENGKRMLNELKYSDDSIDDILSETESLNDMVVSMIVKMDKLPCLQDMERSWGIMKDDLRVMLDFTQNMLSIADWNIDVIYDTALSR